MANQHYRRIMGVISVLLSAAAFIGALTVCVLLCIADENYLKAILLAPMIIVSLIAAAAAVFAVANIGSKLGIAALIISICAAACLIVAFTQL